MAIQREIAGRFAPYIRELHELFGMHGVPFGHPEDLHTLNARLDAPGTFAEDVSSILRSIILREGGSLPHAELLEILALAVSGREVDPASAEMPPEFRKLLTFVGAVAGRPWNLPPKAEAIPAASPTPQRQPAAGQVPGPGPIIVPPAASAAASARTEPAPSARAVAQSPLPGTSASPSGASGSTNAAFADAADPAPGTAVQRPSIRFTAREDTDHEPRTEPLPPVAPVPKSFPSSAPLWIGALCAIALVIGVVFYSHASLPRPGERTRDPESITLPEPVPAPQPAPENKPTPDVPPAPEQNLKLTPPPAPATLPARAPASAAGSPARTAQTARPAPPPVRLAVEPTPDAMLAAAAEPDDLAGEDEAAGAGGPHASLRSPTARAGKGPFFLVSSGIMASHLVEAPPPGYPMVARITHIQGQVILQAVISTEGQVIATRVLSGHRLLRGAAVNAVKRWRYRPYVMNGHPVNVATIITVDFHTHS